MHNIWGKIRENDSKDRTLRGVMQLTKEKKDPDKDPGSFPFVPPPPTIRYAPPVTVL